MSESKKIPKEVRALAQALRGVSGQTVPWVYLDRQSRDAYIADATAIADSYRDPEHREIKLRSHETQ